MRKDGLTKPPRLKRRTSRESKQFAAENGWTCETIPDDVLFLDIDTLRQCDQFDAMISSVWYITGAKTMPVHVSRSKSGNLHVRVTLPHKLTVPERVALQLMLGSDPRKEACSLLGHWRRDKECVLAYEVPGYEKVELDFLGGETLWSLAEKDWRRRDAR